VTLSPTTRLYWEDDHCFESDARVVEARDQAVAFDRTCFYPGGGGQPSDEGSVTFPDGQAIDVASAQADPNGIIWHALESLPPPDALGQRVRLALNSQRRLALMRHHTVLHVLNTIALRDYAAWITGAQIGTGYSRIDFKIEGFSPAVRGELEQKVNAVLEGHHPLRSYFLAEAEFRERKDLLRTLEAQPPVIDGRVRVVEIAGFDAQACGGTHVGATSEVGTFSIFKTENKGRINKRLYIRLD
jgi:misacylated tRNA(Ala) deacylase